MLLQNTLDLSTFEIVRFRIWNQTSQPSDRGFGSKYFNTNSGHEAYCREEIFTPIGWRTAAYMDDIDKINEKLDLIFGDELDTDTIIDSWKEVQDFLSGIEDTKNLMTMLDGKLDKTGGTISGNLTIGAENTNTEQYLVRIFKKDDDGTQHRALWGILSSGDVELSYYSRTNGAYQRFVFGQSGVKVGGTTLYDILHSGNVGDYALKTDGSNKMASNAYINWSGSNADGENYDSFGYGIRVLSYNNTTRNYRGGIHVGTRYGFQLTRQANNDKNYITVRFNNPSDNNSWSDWKTIAFTDSDITGNAATATKLQDDTAYTAWGQTFFENGKPKSIQGGLSNVAYIRFLDGGTNGIYRGSSFASSQNATDISYVATGHYFYINGASAMTITEEGNVLVGRQANNLDAIIETKGLVHIEGGSTNTALGSAPVHGLTIGYDTIGGLAQWIHETNFSGNIQAMNLAGTATAYALNLNPLGGSVNVGGNLAPNANNTISLGTSSYRWSNVYSVGGNFSGRVLIGGVEDDESTDLQVDSDIRVGNVASNLLRTSIIRGYTNYYGRGGEYVLGSKFYNNDGSVSLAFAGIMGTDSTFGYYAIGSDTSNLWFRINSTESNFNVLTKFNAGALIPTGQTLTIGSVTFRETAEGEVEVDGNLHTTGTLASGGKGEVGENTTGNAMVYQYDLASGESVYTVDNVKGSTNVIVQIFEWNSNTSSWDMILTDVSVKADAITVTFGRTTTVNHMVTVC